jgi:hypothetical protein
MENGLRRHGFHLIDRIPVFVPAFERLHVRFRISLCNPYAGRRRRLIINPSFAFMLKLVRRKFIQLQQLAAELTNSAEHFDLPVVSRATPRGSKRCRLSGID